MREQSLEDSETKRGPAADVDIIMMKSGAARRRGHRIQ